MQRLPPALGLGRGAGGSAQAPSVQQQAFEADVGFIEDKLSVVARDTIDASLQGGSLDESIITCWHPTKPILAVATTAALAEYDAISGCRRNLVDIVGTPLKMNYTADGSGIVMLSKERVITGWNTSNWRRRVLLPQDPKYAKRPLIAGLMAIGVGKTPIIFYSPMGKTTIRTIQTFTTTVPKGAKPEKELLAGFKCKFDNKKPICGLAAHPIDPNTVILLVVDGTVVVATVGGGIVTPLCSILVPFDAKKERVQMQALPIAGRPGAAMVLVEAEKSGLTVVELPSRNEARMVDTLLMGAPLCGAGYIPSSSLLIVAARHGGGNIGLKSWRLLRDSRDVAILKTTMLPSTLWDALLGGVGGADGVTASSSMADVSGEALIAGMRVQTTSGMLAFWTARRDETGAAHLRLPLLQVLDATCMGTPFGIPLHTGLSFWSAADGEDGVVTKLRFPRYTHVVSGGRVRCYDLANGILTDFLTLPGATRFGQERRLIKMVKSSKQGVWLAFTQVSSRGQEGALLGPGQYEVTIVAESEAAVTSGEKCLAGRDGVFVGGKEELTALLSNSGSLIAVYETAKLNTPQGGKALYAAQLKDGPAVAVFPGPSSHIPAAPTPRPDLPEEGNDAENNSGNETDDEAEAALQEWEAKEAKRVEPPKQLLIVTASDSLCLVEVSPSAVTYSAAARSLPSKYTFKLRPSESVIQVAWQSLMDPNSDYHAGYPHSDAAIPCVAAVLTTERILILDHRLSVLVKAAVPGDVGSATSCLWVGPSLVVSTAANQIVQVGWDGAVTHLCSLLEGPPVALLGALADRLLLSMQRDVVSGSEVATRGFQVLPVMAVGWAGLATKGILPGGRRRARSELRPLLASYDASQLPVTVLHQLATAGFPDIAANAAARSESSAVTPAIKSVLSAAAGDWRGVSELVMAEVEAACGPGESVPAKYSPAYEKAVALARTCERYGRFKQARELFAAAGAWNELLALCVFQGDFIGLQSYARLAGRDIGALADQLLAVNENAFRSSNTGAYGGRPNVEDWKVEITLEDPLSATLTDTDINNNNTATPTKTRNGDDGDGNEETVAMEVDVGDLGGNTINMGDDECDLLGDVLDVEVAPAGRLPFMEASLRVTSAAAAAGALPPRKNVVHSGAAEKKGAGEAKSPKQQGQTTPRSGEKKDGKSKAAAAAKQQAEKEEEGQPIPRLDLHSLEAYLGIPGATVIRDQRAAQRAATAAAAASSGAEGAAAAPQFAGLERTETEGSMDLVAALAAAAAAAANRSSMDEDRSVVSGGGSEAGGAGVIPREGETAAQAAARAAFKTLHDDDDFFSSDDEESIAGGDGQSSRGTGTAGAAAGGTASSRFMINIKGGTEGGAGGSVSEDGSTGLALKNAAQGLKLGGGLSAVSTPTTAKASNKLLDTGSSFGSAELDFPSLSGLPSIIPPPPAAPAEHTTTTITTDPFMPTSQQQQGSGTTTTINTTTEQQQQQQGPPKDPFADIAGLGTLASKKAEEPTAATPVLSLSGKPIAPALPPTPFGGEEPMRAPPPVASQSDLLSGWDEFEAMFAEPGAAADTSGASAGSQQVQQQGGGGMPPISVPPPMPTASSSSSQQQQQQSMSTDEPLSPSTRRRWETAMSAFGAGQWERAAEGLGRVVDSAPDGRAAAVVDLYAASVILGTAAKQRPKSAARLARFASALPLEGVAKSTVMLFSAEANMAAKNFGFAAEQLTWLVIQTTEGCPIPGLSADDLQQRLNVCDNAGGGDANLDEGEDVESFAAIVSSCTTRQEIDELVGNLS